MGQTEYLSCLLVVGLPKPADEGRLIGLVKCLVYNYQMDFHRAQPSRASVQLREFRGLIYSPSLSHKRKKV